MKQLEYMKSMADMHYEKFLKQGYADAGHNGPHGHLDSPVRNTSHFLVIYSYLYKIYREVKYIDIAKTLAEYIFREAGKSKSGAIECMTTDRFDHLNGLIGQGWVIEALLYYYEISHDERCISVSRQLFYAQRYDYELHLWHRIELDGRDIGIDPTYNHNIWFAACSAKLLEYGEDKELRTILTDLLTKGAQRDFRVYRNGLLYHSVAPADNLTPNFKTKRMIKILLSPVKWINPKKFDYQYMEKAYHIFDMYGFCILEEYFPELPLFKSEKYQKARNFALDLKKIEKLCNVPLALKKNNGRFNVFFYSYNTPTFEYPFVAKHFQKEDSAIFDQVFETQSKLMYDSKTEDFTRFNPDVITSHARTYELIRFLEK